MQALHRSADRRKQAGMSAIAMICVLLVIVSALSLTLKIGPHYIDYRTIQSVVNTLPADQVHTMGRATILENLEKRFPLNNLYDFKVRDIIAVERDRDSTKVTIDYEKRENLFLNLDVVITFKKQYEYR
jgi:hypothetical protein